jgi:ATP-dependent DNA ligase
MLPFDPARPRRCWPGTRLFQRLASSPDWVAEPKKDGVRCIAVADDDGLRPWLVSRRGQALRDQSLATSIDVPPSTLLDGEMCGGVLWVFDVLVLGGEDIAGRPLDERRDALAGVIPQLGQVRTMPRVDAAKFIASGRDEGVVFKKLAAGYPYGQTNLWVKCRH